MSNAHILRPHLTPLSNGTEVMTERRYLTQIKHGDVIVFNGQRHTVSSVREQSAHPGRYNVFCDTITINRAFDATLNVII